MAGGCCYPPVLLVGSRGQLLGRCVNRMPDWVDLGLVRHRGSSVITARGKCRLDPCRSGRAPLRARPTTGAGHRAGLRSKPLRPAGSPGSTRRLGRDTPRGLPCCSPGAGRGTCGGPKQRLSGARSLRLGLGPQGAALTMGGAGLWPALLLLLLLPPTQPCLPGRVVSSKDIQPECLTDFATKLVCHWNVDTSTNCSKEFRLHYSTDASQPSLECVPENERELPACRCVCIIPGKVFELITYHLVLYRIQNWTRTEIWNGTVDAEANVKPRPLVNLTVEKKKERRSFVLTWKRDYKPENWLHKTEASHEVAYWPKDQREKRHVSTVVPPSYEIFADRLTAGADYVASVRYQLCLWGETWSEWSTPCGWHNDFESKPELWKSVSWLCVPIVALILTCYLCFVRVKREWWDQIPSPAQSKMVEMMTATRVFSVVQKDNDKTVFCDTRKLKSQSKLSTALIGQTTREKVPGDNSGVKPEVFLTPEVALVERPLMICSSVTDVKPEALEGGEGDQIPHEDALASLFGNLLSGDWSSGDPGAQEPPAKEQAPEHLPAALCFPPETPLDKHSPQAAGAGLETTSESGYQSHGTEPATASTQPVSATPEQQLGHGLSSSEAQPNLLLQKAANLPAGTVILDSVRPRAEGLNSGGSIATSHPSGYKCFNSLVSQPMTSFSQVWEQWPFPPQADQILPHDSIAGPCLDPSITNLQPDFPRGSWGLSSCRATAAALVLPSEQEASPEDTPQDVPGKPSCIACPVASLSAGYQPFSSALQNSTSQDHCSFDLESPYKPLLSVLGNRPTEAPVAWGGGQ